jgi:hypothetical protein
MGRRRFFNQTQPQTLQIAAMLLYFSGGLLLLQMIVIFMAGDQIARPSVAVAEVVGYGLSAYGIANERRWAYALAIVMAVLPFALNFILSGNPFSGFDVVSLIFAVALVALLVHPQSRDYQRIWFK